MNLHCFSQQELKQYQDFVSASNQATPYHNAAWGLAVEQAYGFKMQYYGLFEEAQLVAVMPAVLMRSLSRKQVLCTLPYCDLGGVLAKNEEYGITLLQKVSKEASEHAWQFEYRASKDQNLHTQVTDGSRELNNTEEFADGAKVRMLFELQEGVDEQLASFKPKLRSQIKKAIKNGVSARVISSVSENDIDEFYSVFAVNMRDLGSPVHAKEWFSSIFAHYKKNAFLVLVDYDNTCVGGGIVIHNSEKAVIPWASTLRDYNKMAPNMLLYWEVLSEVIRRDIRHFDFGRSSYNEGTYRFKKQWGALPQKLKWQRLENDKLIEEQSTSTTSNTRAKIENVWQKLPIGVTTFVGPKIRKHISL